MRFAFFIYLALITISLFVISAAIVVLVKSVRQTNTGQPIYPKKRARISRRIRRQIEAIIRSYDDRWETSNSTDDPPPEEFYE